MRAGSRTRAITWGRRVAVSSFVAGVVALSTTTASASNWAWTKKQAEYYVGGKNGVATACIPLGVPYRKQGLNYYFRFRCGVVFNDGEAFQLVIRPVGATKYQTLSIKKIRGATSGGGGGVSGGGLYADTGSGHWISDKSDDSSVITLEDGSRWLTSPVDRYNAITWLVVDNITVVDSSSEPSYPYLLVDTDDGSSVAARFLGY